ncbi:MAG: hypothetical protein H6981_13085 [Gammaproteobacteria bacterium]|nr:hypothetical protein [Gammaproteobacteria bacterium]MCP5137723.1 hypothetical protein [Gammaproteobacteria bacterium]
MSHPVTRLDGGKGLGTGAIVGIVIVLVAILVGGYFLFGGSDTTDHDQGGDATLPAPTKTVAQVPGTEVAELAPGSESGVRPGDEARALIAELRAAGGRVDLHQVHVRAVRYADAGQPVDAYLLWFFAAREGHGPSAFVLGEMYDPEYFDQTKTGAVIEQPDEAQALKWYQRALNAGEPMADERIASLVQRVEQAAAQGDDNARRMMLAW